MRLMCSVASDNIALVSLINKSVGFIRVNEGQFFITVGWKPDTVPGTK